MSSERARVLLVGQGPTSLDALLGLVTRFEVVALVRGGDPDATTARAGELGVPVRHDASLAAIAATVDDLQPAAVVVSSYDRILPAELLAGRPFLNVHYAPLPRYRGRATVNWAIINGEAETAVSIHHLVPGLDAGGLLVQQPVPIGPSDTVTEVYRRLNQVQRERIAEAVERALAGDPGEPQREDLATYTCGRLPGDGEIDWSASAATIDRLVRALQDPYPTAFTHLGLDRLDVLAVEPVDDGRVWVGRIPGRVVRVSRAEGWVDVLAGEGTLRLRRLRGPDGKTTDAADLVPSTRATLGLRLADVLAELAKRQS